MNERGIEALRQADRNPRCYELTDDEGGVLGYFGIVPVAFCPNCYSSMVDMVTQDLELGEE